MIYDLSNEYQREDFKKRVNELYEKKVVVDLTRKFPTRTNPQNRYLHLILCMWAMHYGCSKEYAKQRFFKWECNREMFKMPQKSKTGEDFVELRSSADLTTEEMTLAIQRFRDYCAYHKCYIPSPDEHEYLLYVEREVSKNLEFL